jgi:hypothetical protein
VAERALIGDPDKTLITLAAIQHPYLKSSKLTLDTAQQLDENNLPSWVPDWRTYESKILSEPTSPHCAHGKKPSVIDITKATKVLSVKGVGLDSIETCSEPFGDQEFHVDQSRQPLAVESLWKNVCGKSKFDLAEKYLSTESLPCWLTCSH